MTDYREEFPDFDPATMPVLPQGFADHSWHNDAMPFFVAGLVGLWVNYAAPQDREVQGLRFGLEVMEEDGSHADTDAETRAERFPRQTDDLSEAVDAALGVQFAMVLREWLTPQEMAQVRQRNAVDPQAKAGICHSHDFCDANMAMLEAFRVIHRREPHYEGDVDEAGYTHTSEDTERDFAAMGRAWDFAKRVYLTARPGDVLVEDDGLTGSQRRGE